MLQVTCATDMAMLLQVKLGGLPARVAQHEFDHIDGVAVPPYAPQPCAQKSLPFQCIVSPRCERLRSFRSSFCACVMWCPVQYRACCCCHCEIKSKELLFWCKVD